MLDRIQNFSVSAPEHEFWIAVTVGLAVGAFCTWAALRAFQRKRLIEDTPTALIRSAPQGYVELQGQARLMDGDQIYARLSNRLCVWYKYKVEQRQRRRDSNGSQRSSWVTLERETSEDMFYLEDATGVCAVDPEGATVTPAHTHVWYGSSRIPGRYHEDDGSWWARGIGQMTGNYRYTEHRIEPGDLLYALGDFVTHGSGGSSFDRTVAVSEKLREWKRDQKFMLANFDSNQDGQIDMQEWENARAAAEQEVEQEMDESSGPPPVDVLRRSGQRRRPFVIHSGTEDEARKKLLWETIILGGVGLPLIVLGLWTVGLKLAG